MRSAALIMLLLLFPLRGWAGQGTAAEAKADWRDIIAQLRERVDRVPSDRQALGQLAIAYNNYAVTLADTGKLDKAVEQLEEALRLDPMNVQLQHNLAIIYVKAGEADYNRQRLKEAKAAWEKALALEPELPEVRAKLNQLNQELPVESNFEKLSQVYFDLRYTSQLERASGFDIQYLLLKARREVGSDFAYWPTHKIVVLLYTAEEFRRLRQEAPEWSAGQYDGKIRVPLPGQQFDQPTVTRILYHEYTHAVVYDLTNGLLPTWLNEGLAEYEAWKQDEPPWTSLRQALGQGRLLSWQALSASFSASATTTQAGLAYEQAHHIVRYLVERYRFWRIKRLLKAVKEGTPFEQALQAEFRVKPARLEEDWRAWLQEQLAVSP